MKFKQVDQLHVARIDALIERAVEIADVATRDIFTNTTIPLIFNDEWDRNFYIAMDVLCLNAGLRKFVDCE